MPKKVLIISDMEFNSCGRNTNLEAMRQQYAAAGYPMPQVVFWNVNGRANNSPANTGDKNVALVSGYSPAILRSVLGGKDFTPIGVMNETLNKDRYEFINGLAL